VTTKNYLLILTLLCIFSCTAPKKRYQIVLAATDKEVLSSQLDSTLPVLKKRLKEVDKGEITITPDAGKKNITIETTCSDKDFISNALLKEGKLEFCELFTVYELAPLILNADKEIFSMIQKGVLPLEKSLPVNFEKENPLISIMNVPEEYNSGSGNFLPPYTGMVNDLELIQIKKYLPVLYKHLPVKSKVLFKKIALPKRITYELYVIRYDDTKFTASGHIKTARGDMDYTGHPIVSIVLDNAGSNIWSRMTTKNTGKYIAIIVDDELMSVPTVNGPIEGGKTEISGGFTIEEAEKMAASLSSGYLPVKLEFVSMKEIAPK
jgi:SecD/SecF fusion protein